MLRPDDRVGAPMILASSGVGRAPRGGAVSWRVLIRFDSSL
jgi:hypothetical protein